MEKVKFQNPLSLNKEVISELTNEKMSYIFGGNDGSGGGEEAAGFMSIGSRCTQYNAPNNACSSLTAYSVGLFCNGQNCNKK